MGISASTVSRALNDHQDVNENTKVKVKQLAEKLNYKPNNIAKSLVQNKTNTIGLMIPDITDPFFSVIAAEIENYLSARNYLILYGNTTRNKEKEKKFIEEVCNKQVDGLLLTPNFLNDEMISILSSLNIPVVLLRRRSPKHLPGIPFVDVDHYTGACNITKYLIDKGHQHIQFIGMTRNSFVNRERFQGFLDTMHKSNLFPDKNQFVYAGRTIKHGEKAIKRIYDKKTTAIFACNDLLAVGAMEWLIKNNVQIPRDISIVGFDNLEISRLHMIQLTTMSQPRKEMGKAAAGMLFEMINGKRSVKSKLFTPEFIERKTS